MFKRKKWKYLILDEAHMIKNWRSQRWQTLLNFNSKRRLLITGAWSTVHCRTGRGGDRNSLVLQHPPSILARTIAGFATSNLSGSMKLRS